MKNDWLIIERIKGGDSQGFGSLVEKYQKPLYWFLRKMGLDHDEAAEVMQQSFVRAYERLGSLRENGVFKNWLYAIALNQARNYLRSRKRFADLELDSLRRVPADTEDPGLNIQREREAEKVRAALARLPQKQREVVVLRIYEQMQFKDVADSCNMGLSAVKVAYHRALKKMSQWLEPPAPDR